jgi:hypothetical protein
LTALFSEARTMKNSRWLSSRALRLAVLFCAASSITMGGEKPVSSAGEPALIGHMLVTAVRIAPEPSAIALAQLGNMLVTAPRVHVNATVADLGHMTVTAPREQAVASNGGRAWKAVL